MDHVELFGTVLIKLKQKPKQLFITKKQSYEKTSLFDRSVTIRIWLWK